MPGRPIDFDNIHIGHGFAVLQTCAVGFTLFLLPIITLSFLFL